MNAEDPITIRNPGRLLTLTYVISLSVIAVLSLVVHFMLDEVISEQNNTGKIVNVSGQQRMLSQRASMFAVDYLQTGAQKSKRLSIAAIEKMKQNHQFLLAPHFEALSKGQPSPLSEELYNLYFMPPSDVDKKIKLFEGEIRAALSENGNVGAVQFSNGSLMFLQLAESDLLTPLHNIVGQYEKESLEKVNDLRNAQNVVLGIIILTILVEAFFIFRPMVAKVSRFATKLQRDANFDYLSGLLNRRAFQIVSQQAIAASHRYKRSLSVVMIDIDFFKRINDTHGQSRIDRHTCVARHGFQRARLRKRCAGRLLQHDISSGPDGLGSEFEARHRRQAERHGPDIRPLGQKLREIAIGGHALDLAFPREGGSQFPVGRRSDHRHMLVAGNLADAQKGDLHGHAIASLSSLRRRPAVAGGTPVSPASACCRRRR